MNQIGLYGNRTINNNLRGVDVMAYDIETRCLHLEEDKKIYENTGSLSFPIYQTATFVHKGVGLSTGFDYSRAGNPTRERVEDVVCSLERGDRAFAYSSGMAAITALMELFKPGDHLIVDNDLYGGSIRLFDNVNKKNGIEFTSLDICKEEVIPHIKENTKAVYVETPTNPMMNVTDIKALSEKLKARDILLIVDNTFMSPYLQNPLLLGADIVVHSGTKYLCGHNDALAGFLITKDKVISDKLDFLLRTTGAGLAPFDCWLVLRGIQTLAVRMDKACDNAAKIAKWLSKCPKVTKVIYPGLVMNPGYEIMKHQARGFGAMITFECESSDLAKRILSKIQLIKFAESLGGTQSLMTYPVTQTHADVPEKKRLKNGLTDRMLRLSVGIENADDLLADLENAFEVK